MKRLVFIVVVILAAMFVAVGCGTSKRAEKERRERDQRERLDSDQRQFRRTFDEEMKR